MFTNRRLSALMLILVLWVIDKVCASTYPDWSKRFAENYDRTPCKSDRDCMYMGDCLVNEGRCICKPGFTGSHCHELDLLPTQQNWGFNDPNYPSWGGTVIKHDGEYHLFASYTVNRCDLLVYGTNSAVLRATSPTPEGPYTFQEQILPPFHHGTVVTHDKQSGNFLLWVDGLDTPARTIHDCRGQNVERGLPSKVVGTGKTGLYRFGGSPHDFVVVASSKQLANGNWTQKVIMQTDLYAKAACNRTNPSPLILKDGSLLMAIRTTFCSPTGYRPVCNFDSDCQHIFLARTNNTLDPMPHSRTWKRVKQLDGAEDPFLWEGEKGHRHMLVHSKRACGKQSDTCVLLASADTNDDWISASRPAFRGHVRWRDNNKKELPTLLQRPKILFDDDGTTPLMFICGVRRRPNAPTQTLFIPFNVPTNRHLINGAATTSQDSTDQVGADLDEELSDDNEVLNEDETNGLGELDGDVHTDYNQAGIEDIEEYLAEQDSSDEMAESDPDNIPLLDDLHENVEPEMERLEESTTSVNGTNVFLFLFPICFFLIVAGFYIALAQYRKSQAIDYAVVVEEVEAK